MAVGTEAELKQALLHANYDAIVGTRESEWLDFKSEPYDLSSPRKGADLAADVASFANAEGGILLLGVQEAALPDSSEVAASKVRGVPVGLVVEDQIRKHVRAHIYPLVHIAITRYPILEREVVAIEVRPLADHDRPAIVDRITPLEGEKAPAHAIGWPTRSGADTHWETPGRMQQLISNGLRPPGGTGGPLPPTTGPPPGDPAAGHLALLDEEEGWEDWPHLVFQALPEGSPAPIADFYGSFTETVGRWQPVRHNGFGLGLDYRIDQRGASLVSASDRRFVAIDRSGVLTAAANGTPEMLGWSNHERTPWEEITAVKINPVVLVEFFTEAVRLVDVLLAQEVQARRWTFRVVGQKLREPRRLLLNMSLRTMMPSRDHEPSADTFTGTFEATGDAGRDAFGVLTEIVGPGWGVGQAEIPFAVNGRIDLGLIDQ